MWWQSSLCCSRRHVILFSQGFILGISLAFLQNPVRGEGELQGSESALDTVGEASLDPQPLLSGDQSSHSSLRKLTEDLLSQQPPPSLPAPISNPAPPQLVQLPTPFPSPTPAEEAETTEQIESETDLPAILPTAEEVIVPERPPQLSVLEGEEPPQFPPLLPPELATQANELEVPQLPLQVRIERTEGLSLQDALDLAVERNPDVRQAELQLAQAQAQLDEVLALYQPEASTSMTYRYSQPPSLGSPVEVGDSSQILGSLLRLDYTFLDGGFRDSAQDSAREAVNIAQLSLDTVIQSIRLDVATAYFQLQQSDASVAIAQASVDSNRANLQDAQARERAGLGTRFDVLTFETQLANSEQALLIAQNDRRVAQRALVERLNFSIPVNITAADPIQPIGAWSFSLEDSIVIAFQNREELEIDRNRFAQAQDQARNSLSSIRPQLNVFATLEGGADIQRRNSISVGYTAGATFSWLIYDGGQAEAQARGFDLEAEISATSFVSDRNLIQFSVEDAFLTLVSSLEQIETAKVAIISARESLRLAQLRFQAGVGTQTEVVVAETALTEARGSLANAVTSYNISLVSLQRSVSGL